MQHFLWASQSSFLTSCSSRLYHLRTKHVMWKLSAEWGLLEIDRDYQHQRGNGLNVSLLAARVFHANVTSLSGPVLWHPCDIRDHHTPSQEDVTRVNVLPLFKIKLFKLMQGPLFWRIEVEAQDRKVVFPKELQHRNYRFNRRSFPEGKTVACASRDEWITAEPSHQSVTDNWSKNDAISWSASSSFREQRIMLGLHKKNRMIYSGLLSDPNVDTRGEDAVEQSLI